MEYRVSYSFSKQNWKKFFYDFCVSFFSFFFICYFHWYFFWFGNRESHPRIYIYFYDRKMTFRCVCDLCTTTTTTTKTSMKKLFQINSKCCPNDRCCCWFYCPYFHRQHYRRALFLRIGNRFMSFYFHFFLHSLLLSHSHHHQRFCSTSCQTVNTPVFLWSVPFSFSMWKTLELRAYASTKNFIVLYISYNHKV